MIEKPKPEHDSDDTDDGYDGRGSLGYLQGICIAAIWVFLALLLVAVFWPNLSERTKFFVGNFFNLLIAFAVIAQVLIYRKQWQVMERQWEAVREQTKNAREAFYIGERAYIHVQDMLMSSITANPISIKANLLNAGRTPAWNVHCTTDIVLGPPDHDPPPHNQKPSFLKGEGSFIPTGAVQEVRMTFPGFPISATEVKSIEAGILTIFIVGSIRYKTILSDLPQVDHFWMQWDSRYKRFLGSKSDDAREDPN